MDLSIKDRKKLWSAVSGICSYHHNGENCEKKLFAANGMVDTNLGEECHIVGERPGAARYLENFAEKETSDNAIVLCKIHHKIVDDNPDEYTVDVLKRMKEEHERTISERLANREIVPFILNDCQILLKVDKAEEDVIGLDVQRPAILSNVGVRVQVGEAKTAIGMKVSGGLTVTMGYCENCKRYFSKSFSGQQDTQIKECPSCHRPV